MAAARRQPTGLYYLCPCAGPQDLGTFPHNGPVAVPVMKDRNGGFYGYCGSCGARTFMGRLWTATSGFTLEGVQRIGAYVIAQAVMLGKPVKK